MNNQKNLWERLAKKNSKYYIDASHGREITDDEFWSGGKQCYLDLIKNDKLIPKGGIILDLGCGIGRITRYMAKDFIAIGLDISIEMIKQAQELKGIVWLEGDGISLPIEDNTVDVVFSYLVFQHMKTREMIVSNFKEVYRVLKPGGVFKVKLIAKNEKHEKEIKRWWGGFGLSVGEVRRIYLSCGFKFINLEADKNAYWLWLKK